MVCSPLSTPPTLEEAAGLSPQEVVDVIGTLQREMAHLKRQVDWFRRQIFGHKSERRIVPVDTGQMSLGEGLIVPETGSPPLTPTQAVAAHHRHRAAQNPDAGAEPLPFFDADRVPMEVITLASPETEGLAPEEFEVIGTKETFRLAQRPGSYVVIKYIRPLIKRRADGALCCPAAPAKTRPIRLPAPPRPAAACLRNPRSPNPRPTRGAGLRLTVSLRPARHRVLRTDRVRFIEHIWVRLNER